MNCAEDIKPRLDTFVEAGGQLGQFFDVISDGLDDAVINGQIDFDRAAATYAEGFRDCSGRMLDFASRAAASNSPIDAAAYQRWANWASEQATAFQNQAINAKRRFDAFDEAMRGNIDRLGVVGRTLGPIMDSASVIYAIASRDGNEAGEAVVQMGLGAVGAAIGFGVATTLGAPVALGALFAGLGAVGLGMAAEWVNRELLRPYVLDPLIRFGLDLVMGELRTLTSSASTIPSPIVLDLDGDGVETASVTEGSHFDHAGEGFAERTGWVGADDGLLVRDFNGNGQIDSGRELFGSETLAQARVQSIATGYANSSYIDPQGNQHRQWASQAPAAGSGHGRHGRDSPRPPLRHGIPAQPGAKGGTRGGAGTVILIRTTTQIQPYQSTIL